MLLFMERMMKLKMIWTWLIATTLPLCAVHTALGQGTGGVLPAPIDSRELGEYAQWLHLSPDQQLALDAVHESYRGDFRLLRDGEMAIFLREQQGLQGGIPQRDRVEALLDDMNSLVGKVRALDMRLFDHLEPTLTDDQRLLLPRVRMMRERRRYDARQTAAAFGRSTPDLGRMVRTMELDADTLALVDSELVTYERRLTRAMKRRGEAMDTMTLDLMDALAERGFADLDQESLMKDPDLLRKVMTSLQEVYADLNAGVSELTREVTELNQRTYESVVRNFSAGPAWQLRFMYHRAAHPQLNAVIAIAERTWIRGALGLDDLEAAERDALDSAAQRMAGQFARILKEGGSAVDNFWLTFSPLDANQTSATALRETLTKLYEEARAARDDTDKELETTLGAERIAALKERSQQSVAAAAPAAAANATASAAPRWSGDRFLPGRIRSREVSKLARELGVDDTTRDVITALHDDYTEAFRGLASLKDLTAARRTFNEMADGDNEGADESPATVLDRVDQLRHSAMGEIQALDGTFFEDLRLVAGDEHELAINRMHDRRRRWQFLGSAGRRGVIGTDAGAESGLDMGVLAEDALTAAQYAEVLPELDLYGASAVVLFRDRFNAQLALQRLSDQWTVDVQQAAREDITAVVGVQNEYRDRMKAAQEKVQNANAAITALNRQTRDTMLSALPEQYTAGLARAYEQQAWPTIFTDQGALGDHLAGALELEDLEPAQREQLMEIAAEYRPEYERVTQLMIKSVGPGTISVVGLDPEEFKVWQAAQNQMTKLRYDRNELNARTIRRLSVLLSEAQIKRIGGLPVAEGESDTYLFR